MAMAWAPSGRKPTVYAPTPRRSGVAMDDEFQYYLMYRSDEPDSIWVPIGMLPWSCRGRATRAAAGWNVVAGSTGNSANPAGADCLDFPEWDHVAIDDLVWET